MERVGVEAQARDRQALGADLVDDLRRLRRGQVGDVDVARPGVAPGGAAGLRPAGDLEHLEAGGRRPSRRPPSAACRGRARSGSRASWLEPPAGWSRRGGAAARSTSTQRECARRSRRRRASRRGRRRRSRTAGGRPAGRPRRPRRSPGRAPRTCRRNPRRGRRAGRGRSAGSAHQGGVAEQHLVGPVAMADPELLGSLRSPRRRGGGAVDLVAQRVLAAGADLGDGHGAARAVGEAQQDRGDVLGAHRPGHGVGGPIGGERLDRTRRLLAGGDERGQVGHHRHDRLAGDEGHQVEPVRADVADRAQRAALVRLEPPVPVGLVEQPVLEVVAGDEANSPSAPVAISWRRCWLSG